MKKILLLLLIILITKAGKSQTDNRLLMNPNQFSQNYYIKITTRKGNVTTTPFDFRQSNDIEYTVNIKWHKIEADKKTVEINRTSDMYVNGKPSVLTVANNLAIRTSAALYPLILSYDANGKITKIENFADIQKRWEVIKKELQDDFYGEGLDRYIIKNGRRYNSDDALILSLNNDCFLTLLFNNVVYTNYSKKNIATNDFYFPFIQNAKAIKNTVELKKEIDEDGDIYIRFSGYAADPRSKQDLIGELNYPYYDGEPTAQSELFGAYFLNPYNNAIKALSFMYKMELEVDKSITIRVASINDFEKPINDFYPAKSCDGKLYIPIFVYSDTEKDVMRHLNPLMDIKDMTRRDYTGVGITIGAL